MCPWTKCHCEDLDHFFIGDTEGNNKWLGQYLGNRDGVKRLYHGCKCSFEDLKKKTNLCLHNIR